mmetsp:Transcript_50026/g.165646  ORF Transcript_50026/g.165646 Transcript_50026/m.165646 type:complete len:337 (-) Transcript_50026:45-1055(-)
MNLLLSLLLSAWVPAWGRVSPSRRRSGRYYAGVSLSGAVASSTTHVLVLPLDVVKTRMQTGSRLGLMTAAGAVLADAPGRGLFRLSVFLKGLPPTAVGYFLQGGAKFGGYEALKQESFARLRAAGGEELTRRCQLPAMLASAAAAEMAATVLLAPLEVLKLRMQTDAAAAARGAARTLLHISRHEGLGALYKGLAPIAMRQVPYTMSKLVVYDQVARLAKSACVGEREHLRPCAIVLTGLVAGAAAAIVSHPADLLLTRLCGSATASTATSVAECVIADGVLEQARYLMSLGLRGAYAGLAPRLAMTSVMTSIQFSLYEWLQMSLGVRPQAEGRNV